MSKIASEPSSRIERRLIGALTSFARRHDCLKRGDRVVAAVSGGPDSTALLHLLASLAPSRSLSVHVVHVHHGLRGREADEDAAFVRKVAADLALPCEITSVNVRERAVRDRSSLAVAARAARYEALEAARTRVRADHIATAHTMDDLAETLLLRLLRGTGPTGLAGIPLRRGAIIRPLLAVRRAEIIQFLQTRGIAFRIDSSNADLRHPRNWIRHELLPVLSSRNPKIVERLARLADLMREDEEAIEAFLLSPPGPGVGRLPKNTPLPAAAGEGSCGVFQQPAKPGRDLPRGALRRVLARRLGIETDRFVSPGAAEVGRLVDLFLSGRTGDRTPLSGGRWAIREPDMLAFRPEQPAAPPIPETPLSVPGKTTVPGLDIVIDARFAEEVPPKASDQATFDADRIVPPLVVRTRRTGDRIAPMGMEGTKKLQDLFVDAKIPRDERDRVPVIADAQGTLWVAGLRQDRRAAAGRETRRFLTLRIGRPDG